MKIGEYGVDPYDTEYTGAKDDHNGRNDRFAKSSGSCNGTVHECRNAVGKRHDGKPDDSCLYNLAVVGKQGQERIAEEIKGTSQNKTDHKGIEQGDEVTFQNPVLFLCSIVLGNEAGTGGINSSHQIIEQGICILGSGIALHHDMVEGVDAGLDKKIGNCKDRILKGRRYTDGQNTPHLIPSHMKGRQGDAKAAVRFQEQSQDQQGRNILGADAGDRNTSYVQLTYDDKKQIQDHIEDPGKGQII